MITGAYDTFSRLLTHSTQKNKQTTISVKKLQIKVPYSEYAMESINSVYRTNFFFLLNLN